MAEKVAILDFLRQGRSGPIWGLLTEEDTVIRQYPTEKEEVALEYFLTLKDELVEEGYSKIKVLSTGEEIQL